MNVKLNMERVEIMKKLSLCVLIIALVMGMFAGVGFAASPGVYVEEVTYLRLPAQLGGDELFPRTRLLGDELYPRSDERVSIGMDDWLDHYGIAGPIRQLITWGDVGLALRDRTTTRVMPGDNVTISELTRDTIQAPILEVMIGMGQKDAGG